MLLGGSAEGELSTLQFSAITMRVASGGRNAGQHIPPSEAKRIKHESEDEYLEGGEVALFSDIAKRPRPRDGLSKNAISNLGVKDGRYYLCVDAENSASSSVVLVAEDRTKIQTLI